MGRVPDDIVRWFDGHSILADRHNLPRVQSRFLVARVVAVLGDENEPWVVKGEWREFKTYEAAKRYRDDLVARGYAALIRTGITFWLDDDELPHLEAASNSEPTTPELGPIGPHSLPD